MPFETVLHYDIVKRNGATSSSGIRRGMEERVVVGHRDHRLEIFNMNFKNVLPLLVLASAYGTLAQNFANGPFQLHVASIANGSINGKIFTSYHTTFLR